ncbi:polypyrimidine tract-binding protein 3 [Falco peregrinus]|uniref:polypyrimidine tract-binding protein 3 n=1 Tax=Falco peregrinus TaxID=8954 RepID=UPI00247AB770|nr:polypyrimidine tract-binding protein 3 [Falco peregrinus]
MENFTPVTDNWNEQENLEQDTSLCSPSRVLHLRQIPDDATEAEIISLVLPFGIVTNILILKGKGQALLEMSSVEAAVNVVSYCNTAVLYLRSQPLCIQYSNYKMLKTDNAPNQARTQAALCALTAVRSGSLLSSSVIVKNGLPPSQGSVLRIVVENVFYPLTLDTLYQIFSVYGSVLKIVMFNKGNKFQALLQYANPMEAYYAKMILDGHSVYVSCCTLRIDFSKLSNLIIKYNNNKSRDFTRFSLPPGDAQPPLEPSVSDASGSKRVVFPPYTGPVVFAQSTGYAQASGFLVPGISGVFCSFSVSRYAVPGQMSIPGATAFATSSVLLVTNLNPEAITPYGLFILFGMYGNVHRVKIMLNKRDNALVQMADATQAQLAITYLNGQMLYGKVLHATFSKHRRIQLPHEGQDDQGLTKDYLHSPLHRYKRPGSKNFKNIFPPSATLHLSNIPPSVTLDYLKSLFESTGSTVKAFKFLLRDSRMALIQLDSVEEAIHALIALHNHDLGEDHHLRISFSKWTI